MTIKKAELHVHLEGTIPPYLAKKIALRNRITLPDGLISDDNTSYNYDDFLDFLKAYDSVAAVIKQPIDYYDITYDYLRARALNGAIYVEMMYSPDHAEQSSGICSHNHLQAIQQAIDDAERDHQILGRVIITAVRHFGAAAAEKVARQALKEKVSCIVGFGLGGDEYNFPPRLFKNAYAIANAGGLLGTVHAGEFDSASGMQEAMDCLAIKRIGHGVMAVHSPETMQRLIDCDIALEVCPSSNIALGLFPSLAHHPLNKLQAAGIKLSLNSDDPPFFKTSLEEEYSRVQQFYNYSNKQMLAFTTMAIDAAFVDSKTKLKLHKMSQDCAT